MWNLITFAVMKGKVPQFVIGAPSSGCGKTTVATGIMALLRLRGYAVQPFKCGPDYIDTKFHEAACGRTSVNLDTFMASAAHVRDLYAHYVNGSHCDVAVIEGMMGLYDGYCRSRGSAAEIARLLGVPVILLVDARSAAYSIAPLLHGFLSFDPRLSIAGVIFNRVGSERHKTMLREVCDDVGVECLGFLPYSKAVEQGERYLGLDISHIYDKEDDALANWIGDNIDWKRMLEATERETPSGGDPFDETASLLDSLLPGRGRRKIVVATGDEAFTFIYKEHIDLLGRIGRVEYINPADDDEVADDTDLLYLPGGYPEKRARALSEARRSLGSVGRYARGAIGGKGSVIAECGGMMYLCDNIITDEGIFPMAGVLPHDITARSNDRHLSLGYREADVRGGMLSGHTLRGHEFHYTQFTPAGMPPSDATVRNARGGETHSPIVARGELIASYTHLYLASIR